MPRITQELILKKSEHHTGLLADLQELSLHQLHLERIELLGQICRRLRILYLQNNLISKLENLNKLKELRYLNLALNNIQLIEGVEGCEKLERLDLTVNFIDVDALAPSLAALKDLLFFNDLYLTGNPCTDFPDYRAFTIASLPRLQKLDGKDVTKTERLMAEQHLPMIKAKLAAAIEQRLAERAQQQAKVDLLAKAKAYREAKSNKASKKASKKAARVSKAKAAAAAAQAAESDNTGGATVELIEDNEKEEQEEETAAAVCNNCDNGNCSDDDDDDADGELASVDFEALEKDIDRYSWRYSPANRAAMYLEEVEQQRQREEEKKKPNERFAPAPDLVKEAYDKLNQKAVEGPDGERPTQRNPSKMHFTLKDSPDGLSCVAEIAAPKFLETSAIDVDVHPTWFQCLIKGKSLLLHLEREVVVSQCKVQRHVTTGLLVLTMPYATGSISSLANSCSASSGHRKGAYNDGGDAEAELIDSMPNQASASASSATNNTKPASSLSSAATASASASGASCGISAKTERVSAKLLAQRAAAEADEIERRTNAVIAQQQAREQAGARTVNKAQGAASSTAKGSASSDAKGSAAVADKQTSAALAELMKSLNVDEDDLPPLE